MAWTGNRRPAGEYLDQPTRRRVLAAHHGICHLCGHPGAEQVDHIIAWSEWTRTDLSPHDDANLAPAHGRPCPTCGRRCHDAKTAAEAARARRSANKRRAESRKRPPERHPGQLGR